MSIQAEHVRQLIARSHAILFGSLKAELSRAIACCRIAKKMSNDANILRYLLVAEATSAKFMKLRSQGKIGKSKTILGLISLLEDELGAGDQSPKPCDRFKKMRPTPAFNAHLPTCSKCKAVIRYLKRAWEVDRRWLAKSYG